MKMPIRLSSAQRAHIVRRASVVNGNGMFAETYGEIAKAFGVTLPCISQTVRRAGVAPRDGTGSGKRGKRRGRDRHDWLAVQIKCTRMYQAIVGKVGVAEAMRIMEEHIKVRGLPVELEDAA